LGTLEDVKMTVGEYLDRIFIEREFLLRSDGRVRYLRVTQRLQFLAVGIGFVCLAWLAYASIGVVFHNYVVASKDAEIDRQRLAYFGLLSEVTEYHEQFTKITRNLEDNQTYLLSLLNRGDQQSEELASVERQLKNSESEHARVRVARETLRQRLESFKVELGSIVDGDPALQARVEAVIASFAPEAEGGTTLAAAKAHLGSRLDQVESELDGVRQEKGELESALATLRDNLERSENARRNLADSKASLHQTVTDLEQRVYRSSERQSTLEEQIAVLEDSLHDAVGRGELLENERDVLNIRIGGLDRRLIDMQDTQQAIIDRLTQRTQTSINTFEETVQMTGIDLDRILSELQTASLGEDQGGPFIPGDFLVEQNPVYSLKSSIALLDSQMDRWEGLQELVRGLPLIAPLDQFRVTSNYGRRRDPVNKRTSLHYGLDLAAPTDTPIMATAPGKVVFAGWKGRYGRVIEISHGHGIRTRYAHLRKILVKVGQRVVHREKIGLLGSSGRSTGPHVHYEVQVNGRPVNPMKFLEAGHNVFRS